MEGIEPKRFELVVGGRAEQVLVDEGEFVTIGQIIAVLDKRDFIIPITNWQGEFS